MKTLVTFFSLILAAGFAQAGDLSAFNGSFHLAEGGTQCSKTIQTSANGDSLGIMATDMPQSIKLGDETSGDTGRWYRMTADFSSGGALLYKYEWGEHCVVKLPKACFYWGVENTALAMENGRLVISHDTIASSWTQHQQYSCAYDRD